MMFQVRLIISLSLLGLIQSSPLLLSDYNTINTPAEKASAINHHHDQPVDIPAWPDKFSIGFDILIRQYGNNWSSPGNLYYDWTSKTFHGEFINWCLPLFDSGTGDYNNYTCSFLAIEDTMYFVNHTGKSWNDNDCCIFQKGLGALPPDWMKSCQYNGTGIKNGQKVDIWWVPGSSSDPSSNPCYAYWNAKDILYTPVGFYGITGLGPTMLNYHHDFRPGVIHHGTPMKLPSSKDCNVNCAPPKTKLKRSLHEVADDPDWPTCPK
jgi:hypothetical protein